jgi:predicted TIM-barrel fold metal-dependent hydrolase
MRLDVQPVDRTYFAEHLAGFLPRRLVDFHTHIWLREFQDAAPVATRGPTWPMRVAADNSIEDLEETYRLMLPGHEVTPVVFGWPERDTDLDCSNAYAARSGRERGCPALLMTDPAWPAEELERRFVEGGFVGLKPYLNRAPTHIPSAEITVYDFLPHAHLEVADARGWIVLLHIPRPLRLADPVNLAAMQEIERRYPRAQLVYAHIGRAYCPEDIGAAPAALADTGRLYFDFSANTCAEVMEWALRAFGPKRLVFGSDLPIVRMRMRRICEASGYVNVVPSGMYGDISNDPRMREAPPDEGRTISFFLYEMLYAFRRAAEAVGLSAADVEDVFYHNALRLLRGPQTGGSRPCAMC